jgi:hypothetical protein
VNRDVQTKIMLTRAERDAWQRAADKAGFKLSEWIRRRVQGDVVLHVEAPEPPQLKQTKKRGDSR